MRRIYDEPIVEIKEYALAASEYVTTSDYDPDGVTKDDNDLETGDDYDYFG